MVRSFSAVFSQYNIKNQLRLIMHNEITEILSTFLKVVLEEEENKTFAPLGPHAAISVSD